jgi:hypothetical protein
MPAFNNTIREAPLFVNPKIREEREGRFYRLAEAILLRSLVKITDSPDNKADPVFPKAHFILLI